MQTNKNTINTNKKPVRRFGEAAYILGITLCALGVCLSAKSGLGVSTVVAPAYVISAYLEPIIPFFTFGNTEYVLQAALLILLAVFMRRVTLSYPLSFVTAFFYGVILDLWRLLFGTAAVDEIYLKIIYMVVGALITQISIAFVLRTYLPQEAYDFAVKEISAAKKINLNKVKWTYDVVSLIVAVGLMLIFFGRFDFSLIGIGTLVLAAVNAPMIGLFGKLFDKFIDFSPLFCKFAEKVFQVKQGGENKMYKVLFIGNSYTYTNDMPASLFAKIGESAGYNLDVSSVTAGGYTLEQFADENNEFGAQVKRLFKEKKFDFVILQEQSVRPAAEPYKFFSAAKSLVAEAKKNGGVPIFYATWGRKEGEGILSEYGWTNESMTHKLAAAYEAAAKKEGIKAAHVGLAFFDVYTHHKEIELYHPDSTHPSLAGSYLAAKTLFSAIFGVDPTTIDFNGNLKKEEADILSLAAKKVIENPLHIREEYRIY